MDEKQSYLTVSNGQLFYHTFGKTTAAPLVIVHGGPGLGCQYLLPQMGALGEFSFAIFYDQRGTGKSSSTENWKSHPFDTYVNDLNELRKAFGFEKISLLAHSFGGVFTSFYATTFPQYVDKIIYLNCVPISSHDYIEYVSHRSRIVDKNKSELDAIRNTPAFLKGDPETVEKFYRIYFKNYFTKPDLANTLSLTMTSEAAINNFKIYEFFYDYIKNHPFDLHEELIKINKPSLIITTDKDVVPSHYMEQLHKTLSLSKYTIIEDCGHFPYIDQPDILFKMIKSFLQS